MKINKYTNYQDTYGQWLWRQLEETSAWKMPPPNTIVLFPCLTSALIPKETVTLVKSGSRGGKGTKEQKNIITTVIIDTTIYLVAISGPLALLTIVRLGPFKAMQTEGVVRHVWSNCPVIFFLFFLFDRCPLIRCHLPVPGVSGSSCKDPHELLMAMRFAYCFFARCRHFFPFQLGQRFSKFSC